MLLPATTATASYSVMINSRCYSFSIHSTLAFISLRVLLCTSLEKNNYARNSDRLCLHANNDVALPLSLMSFWNIHAMRRLRHMLCRIILITVFCEDIWHRIWCSYWEQSLVYIFGREVGTDLRCRICYSYWVQYLSQIFCTGFGTAIECSLWYRPSVPTILFEGCLLSMLFCIPINISVCSTYVFVYVLNKCYFHFFN